MTTVKTAVTALEKLIKFVNQRPGLEFANYGDYKAYNSESREITKDRQDFFELLALASWRVENLTDKIETYLKTNSGRLTMDDNGQLEYCTGQYFPTEYRPAASNILRVLIWNEYRDEKHQDGTEVYKTGPEIRKALSRNLSRRVMKNYFN